MITKTINSKLAKFEEKAYANVHSVTSVRRHHRVFKHAVHERALAYDVTACSCNGFCGGNFRYEGCSCNGFCGSNSRKD